MPSKRAKIEFDDKQVRQDLAIRLKTWIDAYTQSLQNDSDDKQPSTLERWAKTQNIYDEAEIPTSLEYLPDSEPYQFPIMAQRVDGIVSSVCGSLTSPDPYFLYKNPGVDATTLANQNQVMHYAFGMAMYDRRVREAGLMAALRGRGVMRISYQTSSTKLLADIPETATILPLEAPDPAGDPIGEVQYGDGGKEVVYTGLNIETIPTEDFVVYPSYCADVNQAILCGHAFWQSLEDIRAKQANGRYFDDEQIGSEVSAINDKPETIVAEAGHGGIKCYDVLVRLHSEKENKETRYRVTLSYTDPKILDIEEYTLPGVWYVSPAFRFDVGRFCPRRSIADRMVEIQTIANDAATLLILGNAANAFTNVAVSGNVGQSSTQKTGIATFTFFKGNPNFTAIPANFRGEALIGLLNKCENVADAVSRFSQLGLGQSLKSGATATEANALMQGQSAGITEYTATFSLELARMADLARILLYMNWDTFYAVHGSVLPKSFDKETLLKHCIVEVNGKSPIDTPQALVQKLKMIPEAAQAMNIQPVPSTKAVDTDRLMQIIMSALTTSVSLDGVLVNKPAPSALPPEPTVPGLTGQPGMPMPGGPMPMPGGPMPRGPEVGSGNGGDPTAILEQLSRMSGAVPQAQGDADAGVGGAGRLADLLGGAGPS